MLLYYRQIEFPSAHVDRAARLGPVAVWSANGGPAEGLVIRQPVSSASATYAFCPATTKNRPRAISALRLKGRVVRSPVSRSFWNCLNKVLNRSNLMYVRKLMKGTVRRRLEVA